MIHEFSTFTDAYKQDDMMLATMDIAKPLEQTLKPKKQGYDTCKPGWRVDPANYVTPAGQVQFQKGCVDFSSSWFQARKEVS
jgi:hypothetical protein